MWDHDEMFYCQVKDVPQSQQTIQLVIDYMKGKGIDITCQVEGTV